MTDAITKLRTMRNGLAGMAELLIALLDELDGDPDLEDSDEDAQVDDERCDERDSGDDEPWIGGDDRELDDEREPEEGI